MFCANTRPVPVAVTDLGEIAPLTVATRVRTKSSAGSCGTVVVVVAGFDVDVAAVDRDVDVDGLASMCTTACVACAPPDESRRATATAAPTPSAATSAM